MKRNQVKLNSPFIHPTQSGSLIINFNFHLMYSIETFLLMKKETTADTSLQAIFNVVLDYRPPTITAKVCV